MADGRPYPQTPVLEMAPAAAMLVVNLLIPGLGTLVAGIVAGERLIGRGIAQFLLSFILIGWIWGVVTGVQLMVNSSWQSKQAA